jgi:hypothetical protein
MKLANWNVRSLYRPGALDKLKDELNKYGIAITAVQGIGWRGSEIRWRGSEIRWRGSEIFDPGGFVLCYSGNKRGGILEKDS